MAGSPTMRRRRLAAELRRLRLAADMTIDDVAEGLKWQTSKISRVETRKIGINTVDLRKLLDFLGVTDRKQVEGLLELARRATERGWWQAYGTAIPSEYGTLIGLEEEASLIRTYQPELIYGLLQTEAYAHAVIRMFRPDDTAEEIERRVEVRLARQQILTRHDAPRLRVVLNEGVIRRRVGGADVMREQLLHLAAERDRSNVVVQVLPFRAGEHPAMTGPFVLLDFPEVFDLGAVHLENMASALTLEKPAELQLYTDAFEHVQAAALGPNESRDMLKLLAEEFKP
ncbi:MAG: helix-turn-helix domain-containing protein [Actinoallomurus sp.]